MPIFDAKDLDADPDGEAMLARLLYPSPQARSCAQALGHLRAKRGGLVTDVVAMHAGAIGPMEREPVSSPAD